MTDHSEPAESHEEETPWLSFSDAVTALLFIFIATTLYAMMQLEEERERARLFTEQQERELKRWISAGQAAGDMLESVGVCLEKEAPGTQTTVDRTSNTLSLYIEPRTETIAEWFPSCSALIAPAASVVVAQVRSCLAVDLPPLTGQYSAIVSIEGHTDGARTFGACALQYPSNWELSGARAGAVLRRLLCEEPGACGTEQTQEAATIQRLTADQRNLQMVSAGRGPSRPAWRALCDDRDTRIDASRDDAVCALIGEVTANPPTVTIPEGTANLKTLLHLQADDPSTWDQLLIAWANDPACMGTLTPETPPACLRRLSRLRRVDLRVDLRPKQ